MPIEYGCLFCRTGQEQSVVNYLEQNYSDIRVISLVKLRHFRRNGTISLQRVKLFPNYVFFSVDSVEFNVSALKKHSGVIKILTSGEDGQWQLCGSDRTLVEELFKTNGEIGLSKAYYENDKIQIESGFLKRHESSIIAVNHRAKTAHVKVNIGDVMFDLWLGFEEISKPV